MLVNLFHFYSFICNATVIGVFLGGFGAVFSGPLRQPLPPPHLQQLQHLQLHLLVHLHLLISKCFEYIAT